VRSAARWAEATPFYGKGSMKVADRSRATEAVLNAATLLLNDEARGRKPSEAALRAASQMWEMQSASGGWDWLKFELEPWESGDDYGAALAAIVAGRTRSGSAEQVKKLVAFARGRLAQLSVNDSLMMLWASASLPGLLEEAQKERIAADVLARRRSDGGFSLASWGRGKLARADAESDGYATAFTAYVLCSAGRRAAVQSALDWLRTHQRADGSWPGRSVNEAAKLNDTFMTDAATAWASLALTSCGS
jgi:hypothetical protein